MDLYDKIASGNEKIAIVGLGYVGLPLAVAFARKTRVIGYDVNRGKINLYQTGIDPTNEVGDNALRQTSVQFTYDDKLLKTAKFFVVAVPTPVNPDHTSDLRPVEGASRIVGRNMPKGSVVVYESTVYPGVTEDICVPILEEESGLVCGEDFFVAYSPERINPGDQVHRLETITKVVSGMNAETLDTVARVYELVVEAGVYRAASIKVAEACKVIENSQRDINIAFMNELSIIFNMMGIDTQSVLEAARTKWNFVNFSPGLVGGHCIGVDPYYLTYRAELLGYHSQIILAGRRINDDMGKYVATETIKTLIAAGCRVRNANVAILGAAFKENCPDIRNTKVMDIISELEEYGVSPTIVDPVADANDLRREYGLSPAALSDIHDMDAVIIAVPHAVFRELSMADYAAMFRKDTECSRVLVDIKGMLDRKQFENAGYLYWRL